MTDITEEAINKYFPGIPKKDLAVFLAFTFFMVSLGFAAGWIIKTMFF
jgi:hypothetical protein